jgi:hypothetical protein
VQTLLPEVAALLGAATALPVRIAPPSAGGDVVFLWPWRANFDQTSKFSGPGGPSVVRGSAPIQIEFLLVAQQADSTQAVSTLIVCGRALEANPVVRSNGNEGRITATVLSYTELCGLFLASQLPLQPCLTYLLSIV